MGKFFMNLDDGDIGFAFDEFGVNSQGDPLMRISGNMITNLNTGDVHFVDSWDDHSDNNWDSDLGEDSDF